MAATQTGSGKTAAFLLPVIHRLLEGFQPRGRETCHKPECVIITPTRELAIQIYDEARKFSFGTPLKSAIAYGGVATGRTETSIFDTATWTLICLLLFSPVISSDSLT